MDMNREAPRKHVDTSIPGVPGSNQLCEPPNPDYMKWLVEKHLEENPNATKKDFLRVIMVDYRGSINPRLVEEFLEENYKSLKVV